MGGGRDHEGAAIYKKVNGAYVRIAPYDDKKKRHDLVMEKQKLKDMGLTGVEASKLQRQQSRNGDVSYINPENGKVVAELHADGNTKIYPQELLQLRYTTDADSKAGEKQYRTTPYKKEIKNFIEKLPEGSEFVVRNNNVYAETPNGFTKYVMSLKPGDREELQKYGQGQKGYIAISDFDGPDDQFTKGGDFSFEKTSAKTLYTKKELQLVKKLKDSFQKSAPWDRLDELKDIYMDLVKESGTETPGSEYQANYAFRNYSDAVSITGGLFNKLGIDWN